MILKCSNIFWLGPERQLSTCRVNPIPKKRDQSGQHADDSGHGFLHLQLSGPNSQHTRSLSNRNHSALSCFKSNDHTEFLSQLCHLLHFPRKVQEDFLPALLLYKPVYCEWQRASTKICVQNCSWCFHFQSGIQHQRRRCNDLKAFSCSWMKIHKQYLK